MLNEYDLNKYQEAIIKNYCSSIGLPENYFFSNGKQVKPLPPVETTKNGVFIVGAYPSANFDRQGKKTIPIGNLEKPFDDGIYIDKNGIEKKNKSGEELEGKYLKPLGILRAQCWITNLVKVFLFKEGHYENEIDNISERENFEKYAQKSLWWLYKEIEIAEPKIIITLGNEVVGVMRNVKGNNKRNGLLKYKIEEISISDKRYKIIHMVHPGILMKNNEKWFKIHSEGIESLKPEINNILKNN